MALIQCPQCGKEISDQATQCVHCGYQMGNSQHRCKECGVVLTGNERVCPNCGYPLDGASVKSKKNKIFRYVTLIIVVVFLGYLAYGVYQYNNWVAYGEIVDQIYDARNAGVDAVNESRALLMKVWNNALWKIEDPETDQYTRPDGVFVDDFNDALNSLYADEEFCEKLNLLNDKQQELRALKKQLPHPPKGMEEYNDCLVQMVNNWIEVSMTLLNPSGSYDDLNKRFGELFDEGIDLIQELDAYELNMYG